jgi:hypothetical protein
MHTPQNIPPEFSSQSPSPEQTTGGAQYYIAQLTTWISIPHQVTDASSRIRFIKTGKSRPYVMKRRDTHKGTDTGMRVHCDFVVWWY